MWNIFEKCENMASMLGSRSNYSRQKIILNCGGFYTNSSKWLTSKKATINPKNKDMECFQYTVKVELRHDKTSDHPKVRNIKKYINNYSSKNLNFPVG